MQVFLQQNNVRSHSTKVKQVNIKELGAIKLLPHLIFSPNFASFGYSGLKNVTSQIKKSQIIIYCKEKRAML